MLVHIRGWLWNYAVYLTEATQHQRAAAFFQATLPLSSPEEKVKAYGALGLGCICTDNFDRWDLPIRV